MIRLNSRGLPYPTVRTEEVVINEKPVALSLIDWTGRGMELAWKRLGIKTLGCM
jgi:hypothetical protein